MIRPREHPHLALDRNQDTPLNASLAHPIQGKAFPQTVFAAILNDLSGHFCAV
jgi:hypothetical protein